MPTLHVKLAEDADPIATIKGGCCCVGGNCCDHTFTVSVPDGDEAKDIGKIIKEAPHDFEDLVQQGTTDADNFTMSYPKDIDPRLKAAMAAALLLIDYQFFEDEGDCYCNPFRCVCGSAARVPQSSRRWRGGVLCVVDAQVQVLRLLHVRMPPRVGHLFRPARRRRALLLRLLLVPMLPLGYA